MTELAWEPTPEYVERANVTRLMRALGTSSIDELRERSVRDVASYWDAVVSDLGIPFAAPYTQTVDVSAGIEWARWFVGGRVNLATACVDRWAGQPPRADQPALIAEAEDGEVRALSYRALAAEIDRLAKHDERVTVLCQIRGIGRYLGMLIVAEIGDIARFPSARHLCAWAGLTPTVRSSDAKARLGHISHLGSGALRWALIEAAQKNTQGDGPLAETFERIAERRGRQIAKVAVARKILTLCFYGLRDGEIRCFKARDRASAMKVMAA